MRPPSRSSLKTARQDGQDRNFRLVSFSLSVFPQNPNGRRVAHGSLELQNDMAQKRSKRYRAAAALLDGSKKYPLSEAVSLLKKLPAPKFDQTVTLSFHLGVDPKQSDQMVRGTCPLPHGSGKTVRVLVFAQGAAAEAAREAGAEFVGFEEMIKKCQDGFQDFDVAIATPAAMSEVRKLGKVLGPRGLMPNPKTGTVSDDTAKAIKEVKAYSAWSSSSTRARTLPCPWASFRSPSKRWSRMAPLSWTPWPRLALPRPRAGSFPASPWRPP